MSKKIYKKSNLNRKKTIKLTSFFLFIFGILILLYIFMPLISWQIYFAPVFASSDIASPIPKTTILNNNNIISLFSNAQNSFVDYNNVENWYPEYKVNNEKQKVSTFKLSIPEVKVADAEVSTEDYDLSKHLVNYGGTAIPPEKGTAVIFGHSTLPQLFDPNNYETIFANLYKLKLGAKIYIEVNSVTYTYTVISITVVDSKDTSMFEQNYDDSYITIVTCTPPGTVWKRLVIKAKIDKI